MKSEPEMEEYFTANNMAQLLASRQIDIIRMPGYGERLTIATSVFEVQNFLGYRNTVIYDAKHKPCVVSWSTGAFVCLSNNRLTKVPPEISANIVYDSKVEMEYLDRKINIPDGEHTSLLPVQVMRNDIDINRHMNNAQYVRVAMELLPTGFNTDMLRIEYKIPAVYGDLLYPQLIWNGNNQIYILLSNEHGQHHTIMEFSQLK